MLYAYGSTARTMVFLTLVRVCLGKLLWLSICQSPKDRYWISSGCCSPHQRKPLRQWPNSPGKWASHSGARRAKQRRVRMSPLLQCLKDLLTGLRPQEIRKRQPIRMGTYLALLLTPRRTLQLPAAGPHLDGLVFGLLQVVHIQSAIHRKRKPIRLVLEVAVLLLLSHLATTHGPLQVKLLQMMNLRVPYLRSASGTRS